MIEISPSILTDSIENFKEFVKKYQKFDSVDIDVIRKPFLEDETVQLKDGIDYLKKMKTKSLGIHLMVNNPIEELDLLKEKLFNKREMRIYVQQEADLKFLDDYAWPKDWRKCICIKLETKLKDLNFYNEFNEIQFMSIEIGAQGRPFDESVFEKIEEVREMGYNKLISVDGGVNLKSANLIRRADIQRVSVGSYFAEAQDLDLATMKLQLALNIKENDEVSG